MIFLSLVSCRFCRFFFVLEMRAILSLLQFLFAVSICIFGLLPCLTIVKFVRCFFTDVSLGFLK